MRRSSLVTWAAEDELMEQGFTAVAGVDEAGRGALAGPVVAAAVVLRRDSELHGIDDSKCLSPRQRQRLFAQIARDAASVGVGIVGPLLIERVNIRQSTLLAMREAVQRLPQLPDYLLIDGLDTVQLTLRQRAVVRGDGTIMSIAAAAIVAKVTRDRLMTTYGRQFPGYGFAQHKGYGTAGHLQALDRLGPCPIHRRTFRGVSGSRDAHG
jgi:ribonuclease HII